MTDRDWRPMTAAELEECERMVRAVRGSSMPLWQSSGDTIIAHYRIGSPEYDLACRAWGWLTQLLATVERERYEVPLRPVHRGEVEAMVKRLVAEALRDARLSLAAGDE